MLKIEELAGLEVGDTVKSEKPLFPGMSPEPLTLRVTQVTDECIKFVVMCFGVTLGAWKAIPDNGKVRWEFK